MTWPADDAPAAPPETGASAGNRLRDAALRAQAEQQLARPNQPFLF
ncbi:hypothetical protein [Terrabacter aerolatus]|nr:hypothetical protein [Terrabacter aerolatus]